MSDFAVWDEFVKRGAAVYRVRYFGQFHYPPDGKELHHFLVESDKDPMRWVKMTTDPDIVDAAIKQGSSLKAFIMQEAEAAIESIEMSRREEAVNPDRLETLVSACREVVTPCVRDKRYNRCIEHHRDLPCEVAVLAEALKDYDKEKKP